MTTASFVTMASFIFHRIPVGIDNCYLLRGNRTVLIDGGAPGGYKDFVRGIQELEIDPREIELILLTHGHADHIGSLYEIQKLTRAKVAIHRAESGWVQSGNPHLPPGVTPWGRTLIRMATRLYKPKITPCKVDYAFDNGGFSLREYGVPGQVIHTPGHSAGSSCVILDTGEVFAGDMAMNAWFLRSTPGLPVLAENPETVIESWIKIIAADAKRVYPAHGREFPIHVMRREISTERTQQK
jgi:glyoxylase-like metal-dependent hydrolase (beta-lactamase superfamily II)